MKVKYDKATEKWFNKHFDEALGGTTVVKCEKCGLFYKPDLSHKCLKEDKEDEE